MTDSSGMGSSAPQADDRAIPSSDRAPVWLIACVVVLFASVLVVGGLVVNRLLTRDLVDARARDARLQVLEDAVGRRPRDVGARLRLAYAYQQNQLHREALGQYKKVLAVDSGNPGALYNTGLIQLTIGQDGAGEKTLIRLLGLSPSHALAAYTLARHYVDAGEYERAHAIALPAAQAHPDDADLQYVLGVADEKAGRAKEAVIRYRAALNLVPDMAEAKSALERLGSAR